LEAVFRRPSSKTGPNDYIATHYTQVQKFGEVTIQEEREVERCLRTPLTARASIGLERSHPYSKYFALRKPVGITYH
jgi:hypothetical protein